MSLRALVKLGGSVITHKEAEGSVNREALERLCSELAEAWRAGVELTVVHGGGSFPHPVAERFRVHEGVRAGGVEELMGYALTNDAAARLNRIVVASLLKAGLPAVSLQPSASVLARRSRVEEVYGGAVKQMLKLRLVPVLYGDAVMDLEAGFSIASGEALLEALAPLVDPHRVVVCVDVDGVYDRYPGGRVVEKVWGGNIE
ncbi:MAG: isopentenyl phosphate kinase, partial [Candidatus Nezhaarchaeota archaeon]|nr:isopentenyl phosphate kinase [Candidatus Nezhaarchaeota archaeon]